MQENGKVSAREAYEALTLFYFKTTIHGKVAVKVIAGLPQEYLDENTMSNIGVVLGGNGKFRCVFGVEGDR